MNIILECDCGYSLQFPLSKGEWRFRKRGEPPPKIKIQHCPICDQSTKNALCEIWFDLQADRRNNTPPSEITGRMLWDGITQGFRTVRSVIYGERDNENGYDNDNHDDGA